MTCDEVILELGQPTLSGEAAAHVAQCPSCREAEEAVRAAALPPLSPMDEAHLSRVAEGAWARWAMAAQAPRSRWPSVLALAAAAAVGAVVASAAFLTRGTPTPRAALSPVVLDVGPIDGADNLGDEQVFFEVAWPSIPGESTEMEPSTEGEL